LKVLYVAPENVSGGFGLFVKGHKARGNEARFLLFYRTKYAFEEDICLDLHAMPTAWWIARLGPWLKAKHSVPRLETPARPPIWQPGGWLEPFFQKWRDQINNPKIQRAIARHGLNDFDIYHFEQGVDPYRDGRWAGELAARDKAIVCFYHGTDLRDRGLIEAVHRHSRLNLTSEIDLLSYLPGMKYLYLPIEVDRMPRRIRSEDGRIRIGHAARNNLKGSDIIAAAVQRLARRYPVDWVMMQGLPHTEALRIKADCDIYVDQITDRGGWGYGMSSIESLAMGIPTVTRISVETAAFLGSHPFFDANEANIGSALERLINEPELRQEAGASGLEWVRKRHSLDAVMEALYGYYREAGLI